MVMMYTCCSEDVCADDTAGSRLLCARSVQQWD